MSIPDWTEPQRKLMSIIYGGHGLWDPPCQHPGPVWVIDADGKGRCTICLATWTIADEEDRAARIAAGPPEGESNRDRQWREFREAVHRSRPLIMPLPESLQVTASLSDPATRANVEIAMGLSWDELERLAAEGAMSAADRPEWTVSADGYRLVIEQGAIIGLAYDEDPWPWGDPRWLTSRLIADHEIRRVTMTAHICDDGCACPRCGTPMYYWPFGDDHACQDYACPYARGIRAMTGATLDFFPA